MQNLDKICFLLFFLFFIWSLQVTDKEGQKAEKATMLSENGPLVALCEKLAVHPVDSFGATRA